MISSLQCLKFNSEERPFGKITGTIIQIKHSLNSAIYLTAPTPNRQIENVKLVLPGLDGIGVTQRKVSRVFDGHTEYQNILRVYDFDTHHKFFVWGRIPGGSNEHQSTTWCLCRCTLDEPTARDKSEYEK